MRHIRCIKYFELSEEKRGPSASRPIIYALHQCSIAVQYLQLYCPELFFLTYSLLFKKDLFHVVYGSIHFIKMVFNSLPPAVQEKIIFDFSLQQREQIYIVKRSRLKDRLWVRTFVSLPFSCFRTFQIIIFKPFKKKRKKELCRSQNNGVSSN